MNSFVFTGLITQEKFKAFSLPHIVFLLATMLIIILLILYRERVKSTKAKSYLRYTIAILLFAAEASK